MSELSRVRQFVQLGVQFILLNCQVVEIWREHSKQIENIVSTVVSDDSFALDRRVENELFLVLDLNLMRSHSQMSTHFFQLFYRYIYY